MRNNQAKFIAVGGVLAALAIVIMCLGGLIPIATYVCPALCMVLLCFVLQLCGRRIAWAWYGAVALLSLLIGVDKEAAFVYVFLGYYPIVKPSLEKLPFSWLWKIVLFNGMILVTYSVLIFVLGMDQIVTEFAQLGTIMTVLTLILGNITLFLLDKLLKRIQALVRKQ